MNKKIDLTTRPDRIQMALDQARVAQLPTEEKMAAEDQLRKARMGEDDFRHQLRQRLMQMMGKELNPEDMPIE